MRRFRRSKSASRPSTRASRCGYRVVQPHLDIGLRRESGQRCVEPRSSVVVEQQAHADAARGPAQGLEQQRAGGIVVPDVVLHVQRALGRRGQHDARRERVARIGQTKDAGLARMRRGDRGDALCQPRRRVAGQRFARRAPSSEGRPAQPQQQRREGAHAGEPCEAGGAQTGTVVCGDAPTLPSSCPQLGPRAHARLTPTDRNQPARAGRDPECWKMRFPAAAPALRLPRPAVILDLIPEAARAACPRVDEGRRQGDALHPDPAADTARRAGVERAAGRGHRRLRPCKLLIVTDGMIAKLGLLKGLCDALTAGGAQFVVFDEITPDAPIR